jgi:hypothetical protein
MRRSAGVAVAAGVLAAATSGLTVATASPSADAAAAHQIKQTWHIHQAAIKNGSTYDKGKVKGDPRKGKVRSKSTPEGAMIRVKFVEKFPDGKLRGSVLTDYTLAGDGADFEGKGKFTGGTGKYAGASGEIKRWWGHGSGKTSTARIHLKGTAEY